MERKGQAKASLTLLFAGLCVLLLSGCASRSNQTIPATSAGKIQTLDVGTVVAVNEVTIDGTRSNVGRIAGATVGAGVGQSAGSGNGRILTGALGGAAGMVVGGMIEKELTKKHAQEVTISMDDGGTIVVVQRITQPPFMEGDRVRITSTPTGEAIVSHAEYNTDGLYYN